MVDKSKIMGMEMENKILWEGLGVWNDTLM